MRVGGQQQIFGTRVAAWLGWFFLSVAAPFSMLGAFPDAWQAVDIGVCAYPQAQASVEGSSELRIHSSGVDSGGGSDSLRYVYQPVSGDGQVLAEITSPTEGTLQAKTLCMFRSSLSERAAHIAWGLNASNQLILQMRRAEGASTVGLLSIPAPAGIRWVRLSRRGNIFSAAASCDGVTWIFVAKQELSLPASSVAGIGVSTGARGLLGGVTLRNLRLTVPGPAENALLIAPTLSARRIRGSSVELTWTGATAPDGVAGYEVFREGVCVASLSPFQTAWIDFHPGSSAGHSYAVIARDSVGGAASSAPVRIAVPDNSRSLSFSGTLHVLGENLAAGTQTFLSESGTFTLQGAGSDIGGRSDSAQFLQQPLSGDGQIIVRLSAIRAEDANSRAGILIRDGLRPDAPYAAVLLNTQGMVVFQYRSTRGGLSQVKQTLPARSGPCWLKMIRSGNVFSAFVAGDDEEWIALGQQTLGMQPAVSSGISLSSRSAVRQARAEISHAWIVPTRISDQLPPSAPELSILETTGASVRLSVRGSRDDEGIAGFKIFRDGAEIAALPPWISSFGDMGRPSGMTAAYAAVAMDSAGKVSARSEPVEATTALVPECAPWSSMDFGRPDGFSTLTRLGDVFGVNAAGFGVRESGEEFHFLHQTWTADGEISARVIPSSLAVFAGLMVRSDLTPGAPSATIQLNAGLAPFRARALPQGKISMSPDETTPAPAWLKLKRTGGLVSAYKSVDGRNWVLVGVSPLPAGKAVYAGLMTASGISDRRAHATFDQVQFSAADPSPSPQPPEVRFETLASLPGAIGVGIRGRWFREMGRIYCGDLQGSVEFLWEAPAADVYRLHITGGNRSEIAEGVGFGLDVFVDDVFVTRLDLLAVRGKSSTVDCLSPWLSAGAHRIRIQCANPTPGAHLQIEGLSIQRPQGPDADGNGLSDWTDSVLDPLNTIDRCPQTSRTSPVCIEGAAQNIARMALQPSATPNPALDGRWFANVPLRDDSSETPVEVRFDHGRAQIAKSVRWIPTNILETRTLSIRKGDALLLTVQPDASAQGPISIRVSDTNRTFSGSAEKPIPCAFEKAGVFTVQGAFGSTGAVRGVLTVKVVDSALPQGIVTWVNQARIVDGAGLGSEVSFDGGLNVQWEFLQNISATVRRFRVRSCVPRPAPVLARLGPDGPIVDRTLVDSFDLANAYARVAQDYPDGSLSVSHTVTVRGSVSPDMEVRFEVFVAGVLFEDGRRVGVLKAADFDPSGMGSIRMLIPKGARTSVCHQTRVYQAGVLIGQL